MSHKILTGGPGTPNTLSQYYYFIYIYMAIFNGPAPPDAEAGLCPTTGDHGHWMLIGAHVHSDAVSNLGLQTHYLASRVPVTW